MSATSAVVLMAAPAPATAVRNLSVSRSPGDGAGGFIYREGQYDPLDTVDGQLTVHLAVNNRGQTAGTYVRSADSVDYRGFIRDSEGGYTDIDVAPVPPRSSSI